MDQMQSGKTAVILKFPIGGRKGLAELGKTAAPAPFDGGEFCEVSSGAAWYHEEAIRDAERGRKG